MNQFFNLLHFGSCVSSLEVKEDGKMLLRCQAVKENIVLGTHTHKLSHLVCLVEHIEIEHSCLTFCAGDQASKHTDCGAFTCAVLTKKRKDLILVHFQVDAFHSLKPVFVSFLQIVNAHIRSVQLLSGYFCCDWFIILRRHVFKLHQVIFNYQFGLSTFIEMI